MSLSSIAVQQREKEAKSLKSVLAFSLIGSLTLHVGLLASGIGNLFSKTPDLTEEPLEVVVVDPPKVEEVKPKPQPQLQQTQASTAPIGSGGSSKLGGRSGGGGGIEVVRKPASPPKAAARTVPRPQPQTALPAVVAEKPPQPKAESTQELVESLKSKPAPPPKPVQATPPPEVTKAPQSAPAQSPAATNPLSSPAAPAQPGRTGNGTGNYSVGAARGTGTGYGTSTGTGSGPGTGTGNGYGRGSGSGTGTGDGSTRGTRRGRGSGEGDEQGTGSGRLACRRCSKPEYPSSAKRQGVEGTTRVRVSVDTGGNVTNVQIAQSSGSSALDEAALRAVRRWKFEELNRARQGVVSVSFALKGSERAQLAEKRQERRQAARKKRGEAEAANSVRRRTEAAARRQQQPQSSNSLQQPESNRQDRLREALRNSP